MSGPRVFGLPHLSEDAVAAFADGVLSAAAASRAQRHCAECAECADAVRGQRETAMMLRTAPAPALPSGLLDRLAGLPMSASLPPPSSGLPTVLGADGTAMFVAHDMRKTGSADSAGSVERPGGQPADGLSPGHAGHAGQPRQSSRQAHRRGALPVTVIASAAAVVAAGTFGGHVSTLAAANRQAPAGAANAAGVLSGGQQSAARVASSLGGTASVLSVSHTSASTVPDQVGGAVRVLGGALSVSQAPRRQAGDHPGTGVERPGTGVQRPGSAASAGSSQAPPRRAMWSLTALAATMAGAPTATP
jgi:hypothetical protein